MAKKCYFCDKKLIKGLCPECDLNGADIDLLSEEEIKNLKKQQKKLLRKHKRAERRADRKLERKVERAERRAKRRTERKEKKKEKWRAMTGKQKATLILIRFLIFVAIIAAAYFGITKLF